MLIKNVGSAFFKIKTHVYIYIGKVHNGESAVGDGLNLRRKYSLRFKDIAAGFEGLITLFYVHLATPVFKKKQAQTIKPTKYNIILIFL